MTASDLDRFISAQDKVLAQVSAELIAGRKQTHWIWFIFPQLAGLGRSETARFYAIDDVGQAKRYLADPVLGARLREHVGLMLQHKGKSAREILGSPDDLKFCSCLTLFEAASSAPEDKRIFADALQQFYGGRRDVQTLSLLQD
jgi:uncharacterized protein (DUF1810 family)